jgi:hypothetical protein
MWAPGIDIKDGSDRTFGDERDRMLVLHRTA